MMFLYAHFNSFASDSFPKLTNNFKDSFDYMIFLDRLKWQS